MELMERMVLLPNYAWLHLNSTSRKKCTHLEVIVYIIKLVPALVVGRVDEFLQREWKKLQIVVFAEYRLCYFHFFGSILYKSFCQPLLYFQQQKQ